MGKNDQPADHSLLGVTALATPRLNDFRDCNVILRVIRQAEPYREETASTGDRSDSDRRAGVPTWRGVLTVTSAAIRPFHSWSAHVQ